MLILSLAASGILVILAGILIWYFSFSKRVLAKEWPLLIIAFGTAFLIAFEMYKAFKFLAEYMVTPYSREIVIISSGLSVCVLIIPNVVTSIKRGKREIRTGIICLAVLLMLVVHFAVFAFTKGGEDLYSSSSYVLLALFNIVTLSVLSAISTDLLSSDIRKINDELIEAQNAHYEAVKESNFELRRVRHDMKNHLLAIRELAAKKETEELLEYIDSISGKLEAAAPPYRSGNDIADAIILEKFQEAAKRGITLNISGDLSGLNIEPVDLVTILANLLDNAIEAVTRMYGMDTPDKADIIELEFKKNSNFILIEERNYAVSKPEGGLTRSSKMSPDHGFGIYNIKTAVKKYGGEFNINSTQQDKLCRIEVEIIIPIM